MPAESAKKLLIRNNRKQYQDFLIDESPILHLPAISAVPWIGAANRFDTYEKTPYKFGEHQINFISKNGEPYSFQWQTDAIQLKQAVRWGIVRTESLTSKVIAALGNYRITAHERVLKGMISNTQHLKVQLLDHYQQRFEALQELESLVNKDNSLVAYSTAIERYRQQLLTIDSSLETHFRGTQLVTLNPKALSQLREDIRKDIAKAESYLQTMVEDCSTNPQALRTYSRARGKNSILYFVKQQMSDNLFQMQGINQDISYSRKRRFALTRGHLNDCIEDARREVDEHKADLRNAITPEHHGWYTSENGSITYDFGNDNLTPSRQRQVLLGISFLEGWDTVDYSNPEKPSVKSPLGSETLSVIVATNWQLHRNFAVAMKSAAFFIFNIFKGMFTYTHPWEEEAWDNKEFHLIAKTLREKASPNEPLLLKPIKFIKAIMYAIRDSFRGIRNLGTGLFHMPKKIFDDWNASKSLQNLNTVIEEAEHCLARINREETERLQYILIDSVLKSDAKPVSMLARTDYHLTAGEQNDIITAMVRGFDGFVSVFTHNVYAKDPVAGLLFTTAYAAGAGAIFYPAFASTVFGAGYVNWFTHFSYSMGSGKFAAALAGGSTQAQVFATGWDTAVHGPNSSGISVTMQIAEDPLTYSAYFALAYGLGYVLVNGINGHKIPVLSDMLREDLGSTPDASYPFIGGKFALGSYELFHRDPTEDLHPTRIKFNGTEYKNYPNPGNEQVINRFLLALWLSKHAETLPKLDSDILFELERHLDRLFLREEAASLKKILYPEKELSIAFQLFSIPFSYIPAICRFSLAFILSPIAWFMGNPEPAQPIKRASRDLYMKISRDLNRLLIAGSQFIYLCFKVMTSPVKALAFTVNMLISRIAALVDLILSHSIHQKFARVHAFFNNLGEWMYPARAIKSVVIAHPVHTIKEIEHSYKSMLEQFAITRFSSDVIIQEEKQLTPSSLKLPPSELLLDKRDPPTVNI